MNFIARIILFFTCICLFSCASQLSFQQKMELSSCLQVCKTQLLSCKQSCHNNCPHCCSLAKRSALKKYQRYKHEECVKGGFIALQLNSFRDPLQCLKVSCNCPADYQNCTQACEGLTYKQLQAVYTSPIRERTLEG